ncbi:MAG TPA: DUF6084 family protein [Candidatus Solibacter sp.]|nr:DUF6084 family protein [Candidatus Solibacter sp.]
MPELNFKIEGVEVEKFAATPQINFKLRLSNAEPAETIHSVALRAQIQIEVTRRRYSAADQEKLRDLFGEPERWSQTLHNLLWTHVNINIPAFHGSIVADLPVPCTFDFNVGATKYFYGLGDGDIPLCVMFSGTIFYARDGSHMQVSPISWEKEARFTLPVKVWRDMMDTYYPNSAWLCLRRDVFERLCNHKVRRGIPTWEQVIESMLDAEEVKAEQLKAEEAVRS